jgi:NitT/TauT family transport system substrate-binding protein
VRRLFESAVLAMTATLAGVSLSAHAADDVAFAFDWIYNGTHAGYFVADAKGYYREAGINVTLSRGAGSGDTVKRVGAGQATFGVADTSVVIAARGNDDIPVRIVAMAYGKSPLGVIYLAESGIKGPKDLQGRTIARTASGSSVTMFPGFLAANSVDRASIKEVVADANLLPSMLLSRRVDAVLGQTVNIGRYRKQAEKQQLTPMGMNYADFGLQAYGNSIITQQRTIEAQPDLVRRFVGASMRGMAFAVANPQEAVAILKKAVPELDAEAALDEAIALRDLVLTEDVRRNGVGYASAEGMAASIAMVNGALKLKRAPQVAEVFDSRFLPRTPILPAK